MARLLVLLVAGAVCTAALPSPDGRPQHAPPPAIAPSYDAPAPAAGYGTPACEPRTHYVTITSTKIDFETQYNTYTALEPTTRYQQVTETQYQPSTVYHSQYVTAYGAPITTSPT